MRYQVVLFDHKARQHYLVEDSTVSRAILRALRKVLLVNPEFLGPVKVAAREGEEFNPNAMSDQQIGEFLADRIDEQHVFHHFRMMKYDDDVYMDPISTRENPEEPRLLVHMDKGEDQMYLPCGFVTPKLM